MNIKKILSAGVQKNIITDFQKNELLKLIDNNIEESKSVSTVIKLLYYIGAFIMLCAMSVLMSHTVQHTSYLLILGLGSLYAFIFFIVGNFLWGKNEKFPAGILYLLFILSVSFIILDIEKMSGFFPHFSDIDVYDNYVEMCRLPMVVLSILTIIFNSILQKYRSISALALPSIFCTYSIYITILHYFFGNKIFDTVGITNADLIFSFALLAAAFIKDRMTKVDYSKWMYLFASIGIFTSMSVIFNDYFNNMVNESIMQVQIFMLSLIYCIFGTLIQRKAFSVIGLLGVIEYILYLEFKFLPDNITLSTSIVLLTGLMILYAGVLFSTNSKKISLFLENLLPQEIRNYLPQNRKTKNI